jgi:hypothetical protein
MLYIKYYNQACYIILLLKSPNQLLIFDLIYFSGLGSTLTGKFSVLVEFIVDWLVENVQVGRELSIVLVDELN